MDRILYTKYSNERDTKLRIKTHVMEGDNQRYILKLPMTDEAQLHIDSIYNMYNKLTELYGGTGMKINQCTHYRNGIKFEFLNGITFEEILDEHLAKKDYLGIIDLIKEYKSKLFNGISTKQFVPSKEFNSVFGDVDINTSLDAISVSNIDMIFSNIIVDAEGIWNIIDYEWTFMFDVPVNFILYRALCDYLYRSNKRDELWHLDLLQLFGIGEDEKKLYQKMESAFQRYVSGDTCSLVHINESINNTKYAVKDLLTTYIPGQVQVFYDYGEGFSEDNSEFVNCVKDDNGMYKLSIDKLAKVKSVRIDPTNQHCIAKICDFKIIKREYDQKDESVENTFFNNGVAIGESLFVYNTDDPQWVLTEIDDSFAEIDIVFSLACISPEIVDICINDVGKINEQIRELNRDNQEKDAELNNRLQELEHRQEEINNRDRIIMDLNKQIIEKDIELDNRLKELDNRMNVINDKDRNIAEYSVRNKELSRVIEGYENSTSWKITKPVRAIGKLKK